MENLPFTTIDYVILGVLLLSAIFAWGRGFVRELLSLVAWAGAALTTIYGFSAAKPYAYDILVVPVFADVVLALVLFIASFLLFSFIARAIAGRVKESKLKPIDRGLGLFFGLVRGYVVVSLVYLLTVWVISEKVPPEWFARSTLIPFVGFGAGLLTDLVPDAEEEAGEEALQKAKEQALDAFTMAKFLRIFTDPDPKSADTENESGYNRQERGAMERLIENHQ
ncbi:MAG: CvpA family protein [Alphaproteobacteria bacterium]|nr:CvpA family protein [Alphaproteobacteria bacterium]